MMNKSKVRLKKLNNKGSALVVVVIVIAFITILATLILYLSVMNYHMKGNDYRTKVSFYGAEVPLEEMRLQFAVDLSFASERAYRSVLEQYGNLVDGTGTARKAEFVGELFAELESLWNGRVASGGSDLAGVSLTVRNTDGRYHIISGNSDTLDCANASCTCDYHIIVMDMPVDALGHSLPRLEIDATKAVLHNIKSVCTKDGYTSVISTDFCFMIPEYDWSVDEYSNTWVDGTSTTARTEIDYEKCVVYLNWTKQ